jgi:plasmid replication initiation protein
MSKEGASEPRPLRTIYVKPYQGEMIKAGEIIEIVGHYSLGLSARRTANLLIHNAHGPDLGVVGKEFEIDLAELRGAHCANDDLEQDIEALMKTIVRVKKPDGSVTRFQLLGGNNLADKDRPRGKFKYRFDPEMIELIRGSGQFAKMDLVVLWSMRSRYAMSLYELIAKRFNLTDVNRQKWPLDKFRELIGVPEDKYPRFGELNKHVFTPAIEEINFLVPQFSIKLDFQKRNRKVAFVTLTWWRKSLDEYNLARRELDRPKVGRKARQKGEVVGTL